MTNTGMVNTIALAANIRSRCGEASTVERIIPVEYSDEATSTPRTHTASWPRNSPLPRIWGTGSSWTCALSLACIVDHWPTVSAVKRAVKPMTATMRMMKDHTVERTVRSLVHSASSNRPKCAWPVPTVVRVSVSADIVASQRLRGERSGDRVLGRALDRRRRLPRRLGPPLPVRRVELDVRLGQLHERLLQRGPLR